MLPGGVVRGLSARQGDGGFAELGTGGQLRSDAACWWTLATDTRVGTVGEMTNQDRNQADHTLQPLMAHLYGPSMSRLLAELAEAGAGQRVIIVNSEVTRSTGWSAPGDEAVRPADVEPDVSVADPLPVIEFYTWQGVADFRAALADGWDVVIGFPPQGHPRSTDLPGFLSALAETATPASRVFLFLLIGALLRNESSSRQALLEAGSVRTLVFPTTRRLARMTGLPTALPAALVHWVPQKDSRPTRVTQLGAAADEAGFEVVLDPERPWSVAALDPKRVQKLQRWAQAGDARALEELADFPPRTSRLRDGLSVLMPQQITSRGLDLTLEVRPYDESKDGRLVELAPGDIVGRTLGAPVWAIVTEDDTSSGLAATRQTTVIRPKEIAARYLLAFLHSDACALQLEAAAVGTTVPRVPGAALRQLQVPVLDVDAAVLPTVDPIQDFRSLSEGLAGELEERYRAAFDKPDAVAVTASLTDAAKDAAMASVLLEGVTDPLNRAREFMPHPLARTLRVLRNHQRAGNDVGAYQDLLRFGETAIILLGAIGLSYLARAAAELNEEWAKQFSGGGVALGTWLSCARAGAEQARRNREPLGGLASALATNSPLNKVLDQFLLARNTDAHGGGPRSPYEYGLRILELQEALDAAVEHLGPLSRSDWFIIEGLAWSSTDGVFTAYGRSLRGDHPDFDIWTQQRSTPLDGGVIYVKLGGLDLSLGGFCILRACAVCLHEELYYPDRLRGSLVRLRSLDRGHETELSHEATGLPVIHSR